MTVIGDKITIELTRLLKISTSKAVRSSDDVVDAYGSAW